MLRLSLMKSYTELNPDLPRGFWSLLPTAWKHSRGRCLVPGDVVWSLALPALPKLVIQSLRAQGRTGRVWFSGTWAVYKRFLTLYPAKTPDLETLVPWDTLPKAFQNRGRRLDFF